MEMLIFPTSKQEAEECGLPYNSNTNRQALFPTRLRELRERKGVSQAIVAEAIGVTRSAVGLYEQGDNVPDIKKLSKIADYYNVSFDYLLGKSDAKEREYIDLCEITGLSEQAIKNITSSEYPDFKSAMSTILSSGHFMSLIFRIWTAIDYKVRTQKTYDAFRNGTEIEDPVPSEIIVGNKLENIDVDEYAELKRQSAIREMTNLIDDVFKKAFS